MCNRRPAGQGVTPWSPPTAPAERCKDYWQIFRERRRVGCSSAALRSAQVRQQTRPRPNDVPDASRGGGRGTRSPPDDNRDVGEAGSPYRLLWVSSAIAARCRPVWNSGAAAVAAGALGCYVAVTGVWELRGRLGRRDVYREAMAQQEGWSRREESLTRLGASPPHRLAGYQHHREEACW